MGKIKLAIVLVLVASISVCVNAQMYTGGGSSVTKPTIALTDTMFIATTYELNMWFGALGVQTPGATVDNNPKHWSWVAYCDEGLLRSAGFQYTPTVAEAIDVLTVEAMKPNFSSIIKDSTVIRSVDNAASASETQILLIGDSLVSSGEIADDLVNYFTADGGATVRLLGTQGSSPDLHEGYGGWSIADFTVATGPGPTANPFWDAVESRIDFKKYMTAQGYVSPTYTNKIDYLIIQLGGNTSSDFGNGWATTADIQSEVNDKLELIIDAMHSEVTGYPNCRILISIRPNGADDLASIGNAYSSAYEDWVWWSRNLQKVNTALLSYDGRSYSELVDVCNSGVSMHPYWGYPTTTNPTSDRITRSVTELSNHKHPQPLGYAQMSDVIYGRLRAWFADPWERNYLINSVDLQHSDAWLTTANFTFLSGQIGVDGVSTTATLVTENASGTFVMTFGKHDAGSAVNPLDANDVVASWRIKDYNMDTNEDSYLRVYNYTDFIEHGVSFDWTTLNVTGTLADHSGVIDLGGGWYQPWIHIDLATRGIVGAELGVAFSAAHLPINGTGHGIYIDGIQLEFDVETPGPYYARQ